ncbi:MAG TPA: hypothetical protein VMA75_00725 [Candidatus Paceibacterota bacterium]|nr:hypothetical protein [Candidatus Paceibacterota bacterium]
MPEGVLEILVVFGGLTLIGGFYGHSYIATVVGFLILTISMGILEERDRLAFEKHDRYYYVTASSIERDHEE